MAIIVESPNEVYSLENQSNYKLFLAGSITNCPDWQKEVIEKLKDVENLTIYNPRRADFPIGDPDAAEEQITWEYNKLKEADGVSFWFDSGSLGPITLYELGRWGNSSKDKNLLIGIHPEYQRKQDVEIQTQLSRPETSIVYSIDDLVENIKKLIGWQTNWMRTIISPPKIITNV
jgi:hypothetical protein